MDVGASLGCIGSLGCIVVRVANGGLSRRVAMDLNTHNAFYCTLLISSGPSLLLLIPIVLHSLVSVAAKATVVVSNVTALAALLHPLLKMVTSRTTDICRYSAQTEVGIFFVLILQLATSQRNLILLVLYGQVTAACSIPISENWW